jgi:hypothetical protein
MSVFIGYPSFMAYQMMKGKKDNNDGFPSIPGMIARYSASGLTNEQMATNPVWVDKTGNGHDLQMKNFAWGGMSGVGGYGDENHLTFYKFTFDDYVFIAIKAGVKHMNFTFRVTGLQPGNKLTLAFFGTTNTVYGTWDKDGIYTVNSAVVEVGKPVYFYNGYGSTRGEFTIEILPLYPGFILGDGVDDFAVTEKELNFEDTYTVYTAFIPFQVDPVRAMEMCGKDFKKDFYLYYSNNHIVYYTSGLNNYIPVRINQFHIIVCKRNKTNAVIKNLITGESKTFSVSELIDNPGVYYLWRYQRSGTSTAKSAIAGQTICNGYFSTDEDDEKVLDWYKKQYPWLFPDQAWTVTGKTNEDEDRATIANITGNGNDLVLSNFGFAEGSGYGLYAENYAGGRWVQSTDRADLTWTSYSVNITSVKVASTQLYYQSYPEQPSFTVSSYKIKVYGLKDGQTLSYKQVTSEGQQIYKISEDGIYTLPSFLFKANGDWYGFTLDKIQETCDITIEQIPEYEGYLVTDGVDDKITSSAFKMGKDWTVVGDWKFINDESKNAGIIKPSSLYVYNALNGVSIFINSGSIGNNIKENKGFNAICSNGRAYDRNWTEYSELKVEEVTKSNSELKIGASSNDTTYTRMAFKNFAIYPKVLSKDDCIKAYNYLQTLKAK